MTFRIFSYSNFIIRKIIFRKKGQSLYLLIEKKTCMYFISSILHIMENFKIIQTSNAFPKSQILNFNLNEPTEGIIFTSSSNIFHTVGTAKTKNLSPFLVKPVNFYLKI